ETSCGRAAVAFGAGGVSRTVSATAAETVLSAPVPSLQAPVTDPSCSARPAVASGSYFSVTSAVPPGATLATLEGETEAKARLPRIVSVAAAEPMFLKRTFASGGATPSDVAAKTGADWATTKAAGPGCTITVSAA